MDLGFVTRSIRPKLLVSLTVVLVGATIGTNVIVTRLQASRLESGSVRMAESMRASAEALQAELEQNGEEVATLIADEARASGEALADLLARVAPAAILSNDFMALVSYVKGVNENPGVAYAAFVSEDERPLTRYLDKEKPALQPLLVKADGGKRNVAEVIEASRNREGFWVIEKPITVEGRSLGTAVLGLDRSMAEEHLRRIDESFARLSQAQEQSIADAEAMVRGTGKTVAAESALVLWVGAAISAFLVLLVAHWNATSVLHGLQGIVRMLRDISEGDGDLTQRLEVRTKDELHEVATWFNRFVEKTRSLVDEVKEASAGLASMAEELSSTTVRIADGTRQVSAQAESVATAAEEMSSTVEDVARSTSEVGLAASNADQAAKDGESVILDSGQAMSEIADVVGTAAHTVESLGRAAQEITVVTEVIHDIADQTNLLALNAAIEAARAGEHGRGFAVVADEVRKLAEKTVRATGEISERITAIHTESERAVEAMSRGSSAVARGQEFGHQVASAIEGIRAKVSNAAEQTAQIAAAIEELSSTNHETARNVVEIAREVGSTSSAAEEISSTSEELSRRAEGLRVLTGRFRT